MRCVGLGFYDLPLNLACFRGLGCCSLGVWVGVYMFWVCFELSGGLMLLCVTVGFVCGPNGLDFVSVRVISWEL